MLVMVTLEDIGSQLKSYKVGSSSSSLFHDAHHFCLAFEHHQCMGALSRRNMMPLSPVMIVEIFDVWHIDFVCNAYTVPA